VCDYGLLICRVFWKRIAGYRGRLDWQNGFGVTIKHPENIHYNKRREDMLTPEAMK
jgi:hypothetical protein